MNINNVITTLTVILILCGMLLNVSPVYVWNILQERKRKEIQRKIN